MADDKPPLPPGSYSSGQVPSLGNGSPGRTDYSASAPPNSPQIVLNPSAPTSRAEKPRHTEEHKDGAREVVETIVFVVVLVLLLKTFLAEAFVIPTGSMATTLLGYHRPITCRQCGYPFTVNASSEGDPQDGVPRPVAEGTCPNCRYRNELKP